METTFRQAVESAASRPEVCTAIHELYVDVQREIDARRPLCILSGRCCRFEEFGHRLYITTIELAAFVADLQKSTNSLTNALSVWPGDGCPFQLNKLCSVHTIRPFGCRIFFCDATAADWQVEQYQKFHERLKRLHESLDVPYFYKEWREGIREINE